MKRSFFRCGALMMCAFVFCGVPYAVHAVDTTAPTITSITRYNPTTTAVTGSTAVFRVTFSEAVTNVSTGDFILSGTGATGSTITSITTQSQSVYDANVTVADGTLSLGVRTTVDNIEDLAGNDYDDAVGTSESYTVTRVPVITITAKTKTDTRAITDTTVVVEDETALLASGVTVSNASTVGTSNFSCTQTTAKKVTCTLSISSSGTLVIAAADSAGNSATASMTGYSVSSTVAVDRPDLSFTDKAKGLVLSKKKNILINKSSVTFEGDVDALKGGRVKIYDDHDKIGEATISTSTGTWSDSVSFSKNKTYDVRFVFYDKHGAKISTLKTYRVTVDTTKPSFGTTPTALKKSPGAKIWWHATDENRVSHYRVTWDALRGGKTQAESFFVPTDATAGTHKLMIRAYDEAGNTTDHTITVTVKR